jgi:cytochrome c-type biogenesis protein CcmH
LIRIKIFPLFIVLTVLFSVLLFTPTLTMAQGPETESVETEAQLIDQMLMCPVCPAESIDQVQVEIAKQMKTKVRQMLLDGYSKKEILNYFEERYGSDILAAPPKRGTMIFAWIVPVIVVIAMLCIGIGVIIKMIKRHPVELSDNKNDPQKYIRMDDQNKIDES